MNSNDYLRPGAAAIALAFIYPIYWIYELTAYDLNDSMAMVLNFADWVYLLTGALAVYVYANVRRILNDHHNYHEIDTYISVIIGLTILFTVSLFLMEVSAAPVSQRYGPGGEATLLAISLMLLVGGVVVLGILNIVIAVVLMRNTDQLPGLMRAFAVITLIQGIFEVTIIFSIFSIFIFPAALIILALMFLRKPQMIELV